MEELRFLSAEYDLTSRMPFSPSEFSLSGRDDLVLFGVIRNFAVGLLDGDSDRVPGNVTAPSFDFEAADEDVVESPPNF